MPRAACRVPATCPGRGTRHTALRYHRSVDELQRRKMPERTGKHYCVTCLAEVAIESWLANDHVCDACAAKEEYPLQSTPEPPKQETR